MTERDLQQLLQRWVAGQPPSAEELSSLARLRETNPADYQRIAPLVLLLRRDSAGTPVPIGESPGLADEVLARLGRGEPAQAAGPKQRKRTTVGSRLVRRPVLVMVGSAALLCIGVLIGTLLERGLARPTDLVTVRFELTAPEAQEVTLVGDFNEWQTSSLVMRERDHDGVWTISLPLKRGRVYTYNFLIDGRTWISDPASLYQVKDGFGGEKSILQL